MHDTRKADSSALRCRKDVFIGEITNHPGRTFLLTLEAERKIDGKRNELRISILAAPDISFLFQREVGIFLGLWTKSREVSLYECNCFRTETLSWKLS